METKEAITELVSGFEEYKKANDEKIENALKGIKDPLLDEKIAKLDAKLDSLEDLNQQMTLQSKSNEQIGERLDTLETTLKRPQAGM